MRTVNLQISETEYKRLGLKKNTLSLSELIEIIEKNLTKKLLDRSVQLANQSGISEMSMEEINDEVKAYRNEKNNS
jgi:hypothetical protein